MRKNKITLAVIAALAIVLVSFQSCKKDNELTNDDVKRTETSTFNPNEIENMDEYLSNFIKELESPTRDSEPMLLSDAEWHLSACLNFKYCDAGVQKTHVTYDTIFTTINVNDGYISLNEINASLKEISNAVADVYQSSDLENKNLLFIKPEIQEETLRGGNVVKTVVAMSNRSDFMYYYFDNDSIPLSLFPDGATYHWSTEAVDTLSYYMNLFKPIKYEEPGRVYFTNLRTVEFNYKNTTDRLFYTKLSAHYHLTKEEMAYYLDSYLGLIVENCPTANMMSYISFLIEAVTGNIYENMRGVSDSVPFHHVLYVTYGTIIGTGLDPELPGTGIL